MVTATASFNTLPENVRKAILDLSQTYKDSPSFLDYIEQVALSNAISERAKKTKYSVSRRFRQAGALGLGYDLLKGSFGFLKNIAFPSSTDQVKDMKGIGGLSSLIPQTEPQKADKTKTFFDKPIKVLIDGITDEGYRDLMQKFPNIIKQGILDAQKDAPDRYKEILGAIQSNKEQKAGDGFSLLEALGLGQLFGSRGRLVTTLLKFFTGLTGIFTAIYAITTSDPWKGLSKMIAQGLFSLSGFTKLVQKFVNNFVTKLVDLPGKLLLNFSVFIEKIFGTTTGVKVLETGLKASDNIVVKALKGSLLLLRKIPLIGTLLSVGVAIDRVRKGDYFGGFLDILSGIAAIFPGIGTGIAFAIDGLNAFLDYKAGGIGKGKPSKGGLFIEMFQGIGKKFVSVLKYTPGFGPMIELGEALSKKDWVGSFYHLVRIVPVLGSIMDFVNYKSGGAYETSFRQGTVNLGEWIANITSLISKKLKDIPYFSSLARVVEHMQKGEWMEALKSLGHSIPFISEFLSFLDYKETTVDGETIDTTNFVKAVSLFAKLSEWTKQNIIDKITGLVSSLYNWAKNSLVGLSESVSGWFNFKDIKSIEPKPPEMKDGGLVPATPGGRIIKVAEGGESEFIIPLSKLEETFTLSNQKLDLIAGNTQTTSSNIKVLGEAILKLAQVFNDKQVAPGNNIFVNGQQQQNYPSASEIAATNRDPIRPIRMQFMPQMA